MFDDVGGSNHASSSKTSGAGVAQASEIAPKPSRSRSPTLEKPGGANGSKQGSKAKSKRNFKN